VRHSSGRPLLLSLTLSFAWSGLPAGAGVAHAESPAPPSAQPAQQAADEAAIASPGNEPVRRVSRHYLYTNERRHDLFFDSVRGLGQGYVGVGADQNYTVAAAAGAEVLWLLDLDVAVVHLHRLYAAAIARSATAEEFLQLFSGKQDEALQAAVAARYPQDRRLQQAAFQLYKDHGPILYQRLRRTYRNRPGGAAATWLNDPALYAHIRTLVQKDRIVPRVGDLSGPSTLQQIGEAARKSGLQVRVIYLSNAESWFRYSQRLARNLNALPLDDRGVVLRTVKSTILPYAPGDVWHFSVQGAQDFAHKLTLDRYGAVDHIMADLLTSTTPGQAPALLPDALKAGPRGLSRIPAGVPKGARQDVVGLVTRPTASPEGSIPDLAFRPGT
jgi:hypothetical protein